MPIYEYKCENGHVFDTMQRISDDPLTECVKCGASVRKILHPVAISFKGSGFYSTDYKGSKSSQPEPKETTKSADTSNGSSGSNGDSAAKKPEKTTKAETPKE